MPDFGLTEALANAMKTVKGADFVRAPEAAAAKAVAAREGALAPTPGKPTVPTPQAPARAAAPPAETITPTNDPAAPPQPDIPAIATPTPEGTPPAVATGPVAPPIDRSVPPPDVRPPNPAVPTAAPGELAPGQSAVEATGAPPPPTGTAALPKPQSPLEVAARANAERFVTTNMGDFDGRLNLSHMPNTDTMAAPDGMKASILQVADDNKDAIEVARRGTISNEQLLGLAQDLSLNTDVVSQVLTRELGTQLERPETVLAARLIEMNTLGEIQSGPVDKLLMGTASPEDVLDYARQKQNFIDYHAQLSGALTEQGRGLNAASIPAPGTLPPEVSAHIADVIRQNNPDLWAEANAIKLATTPTGIANILTGSLLKRTGIAARSLITRVFINGILSGPATWAKILIGNNFNTFVKTPLDLFNAGMTRGMIGLAQRIGRFPTSTEGAQMGDAYTFMHGLISGGMDGFRLAGRVVRTGVSLDNVMRFDPAELSGARNVNPALGATQSIIPELTGTWYGALAHGIDTLIDLPGSRVIGAIDEFTKTLGARGYRTMMTMREVRAKLQDGTLKPGDEGVVAKQMFENPSPEMMQAEEDWAHRMSFQSPFPPGGPGEAISNLINNKVPALKFLLPFMRTATNIFKQGMVEMGPLAALSSRIRNQLAAGGFEADLARGRIVTAMQFGAGLAWMAIHDRLTGEAPQNPRERAIWEADGRKANSILVGDEWRSYAQLEPIASFASAIGTSARVFARVHQDEDIDTLTDHAAMYGDMTANIVGGLISNFANKSTMMGAAKFSEMFADPQQGFKTWAQDFGTSLVPYSKAIESIRNLNDPFLREAWTLHDKIMNDVPGQSNQLGVATDLFGQPRKGAGVLGPTSPFPSTPAGKDDVVDELQALMTHTHTVPFGMPDRRASMPGSGSGKGILGGAGMPLTSQEYSEAVQKGRAEPNFDGGTLNLHDKLSQVIKSPTYQASTPAERSAMVSLYANKADQFGRDRLFNENQAFRERLIAWATQKNAIKFNQ